MSLGNIDSGDSRTTDLSTSEIENGSSDDRS
jgi:hypothetical protein